MTSQYIHHLCGMAFRNSTRLDTAVLMRLFTEAISPRTLDSLTVWVRYTRGADFSGSCYDGEGRILVNVGRSLIYPYVMETNIARAVSVGPRRWYKPVCSIELRDGYQLALFIFLHECYHWLVKRAGRNTRQKESMCDRFAARILVDRFGCPIRDERGNPVDRGLWEFQDLDGYVGGCARVCRDRDRDIPTAAAPASRTTRTAHDEQLLLFPD